MRPRAFAQIRLAGLILLASLPALGCDRLDMYDQPRYESLEASRFFPDGMSARPQVEGTVARGNLRADAAYYEGRMANHPVAEIPIEAERAAFDRWPNRSQKNYDDAPAADRRRALLERGQDRFNIHCSVCHGRLGDGDGMIVRRGFRRPPSYHIERLREAAAGHFFDVMTRGIGVMPSYASRVDVADRWAIAAYIRALQLARNAKLDDVPDAERGKLEDRPDGELGRSKRSAKETSP